MTPMTPHSTHQSTHSWLVSAFNMMDEHIPSHVVRVHANATRKDEYREDVCTMTKPLKKNIIKGRQSFTYVISMVTRKGADRSNHRWHYFAIWLHIVQAILISYVRELLSYPKTHIWDLKFNIWQEASARTIEYNNPMLILTNWTNHTVPKWLHSPGRCVKLTYINMCCLWNLTPS